MDRKKRKSVVQLSTAHCICNRPIKTVLCQVCGHMVMGRVQHFCHRHPNTIHLMDLSYCPKCKSTLLQEYPYMKGLDQQNVAHQ